MSITNIISKAEGQAADVCDALLKAKQRIEELEKENAAMSEVVEMVIIEEPEIIERVTPSNGGSVPGEPGPFEAPTGGFKKWQTTIHFDFPSAEAIKYLLDVSGYVVPDGITDISFHREDAREYSATQFTTDYGEDK